MLIATVLRLARTEAWLAWRGQAVAPLELGKRIGKLVALAVVINPDNYYWIILGFLASLAGRSPGSIDLQ